MCPVFKDTFNIIPKYCVKIIIYLRRWWWGSGFSCWCRWWSYGRVLRIAWRDIVICRYKWRYGNHLLSLLVLVIFNFVGFLFQRLFQPVFNHVITFILSFKIVIWWLTCWPFHIERTLRWAKLNTRLPEHPPRWRSESASRPSIPNFLFFSKIDYIFEIQKFKVVLLTVVAIVSVSRLVCSLVDTATTAAVKFLC